MAEVIRMVHDPDTSAYVDRRRDEGFTTNEIRRCLTRYPTRRIFGTLESLQMAMAVTCQK